MGLAIALGSIFLASVATRAFRRYGARTIPDVLAARITEPASGSLIDSLAIDVAVADGRDEIERLDAAIRRG